MNKKIINQTIKENSSEKCSSNRNRNRNPIECLEHNHSEIFCFTVNASYIKRGCCLNHSENGFIAYSGIDIETGKLLYITEWHLKYKTIKSKCWSNCLWFHKTVCNGHNVDEFIKAVEKHVIDLSKIQCENLVSYENVLCLKSKESLIIYLAQDFVLGNNVSSINNSIGWSSEGVRIITKGVLEALISLENLGLNHGYLNERNIFLDNSGQIRVTNYFLVPNLLKLINKYEYSFTKDIQALGAVIENLMQILPSEIQNFVNICKSDHVLLASEMMRHTYVKKSSIFGVQSRLKTEFDIYQFHEKGAFGDVLKVRNKLDNKEYAIKRIPLLTESEKLYKIIREVQLLSRLNHVNVVRYFNSWIEKVSFDELNEIETLSDNNETDDSTKHLFHLSPVGSTFMENGNDFLLNTNIINSSNIKIITSDKIIESDKEKKTSFDNGKQVISPKQIIQVMYIQMEFCEKFTLRQAIEDNLCDKPVRLWQLFREILEGLSYIHQQGIIHRDLKPDNIFLDSRDQIKIGDFGLATTSFCILQKNDLNKTEVSIQNYDVMSSTGQVGTTLYIAPELSCSSTYDQKVDMYTLGIILFEMSTLPFNTAMERVQTIMFLRSKNIILPEKMLKYAWNEQKDIIRWLLQHDPNERPTAKELLSSNLMLQGNFKAYVASEANFK